MDIQERLEPVVELLSDLEKVNLSYNFYLGGGALRDITFKGVSTELKDWDIFAVPLEDKAFITSLPNEVKPLFEVTYNLDMSKRGVESLHTGFVKGIPEEVNVIVYHKQLSTIELADDFDFNVNQIVMDSTGDIYTTEAFDKFHDTGVLVQTKQYNEERMQERMERMQSRLGLI